MSEQLASSLTNPHLIIAILVSVAVFATFYTLAIPYFEKGDLNKRMKAVSTERDQIRSRERERMSEVAKGEKPLCGPTTTNRHARSWSASTCVKRWWTPIRSTSRVPPATDRKTR